MEEPKLFTRQTKDEFTSTFHGLVSTGYKMNHISIEGSTTSPLYTSSFVKVRSGSGELKEGDTEEEEWSSFYGLQEKGYVDLLKEWATKGICPTLVSLISEPDGSKLYCGIGQKSKHIWVQVQDLTHVQLAIQEKQFLDNGMKRAFLIKYAGKLRPVPNGQEAERDELFLGVWTMDKPSHSSQFRHLPPSSQLHNQPLHQHPYQQHFQEHYRQILQHHVVRQEEERKRREKLYHFALEVFIFFSVSLLFYLFRRRFFPRTFRGADEDDNNWF